MPGLGFLFGPMGSKIGWGVSLALIIACGILWMLYAGEQRHSEKLQKRVTETELRLTISNTSLKSCSIQIEDNNRRIKAANDRLQQDRERAAADKAAADARYEAQRATVSALEASARRADLPACKVSGEALKALEGL